MYMLLNRRGSPVRMEARLRATAVLVIAIALVTACQSGAPAPAATPQAAPTSAAAAPTSAPATRPTAEQQPIAGGPVLLRDGIALRKVVDIQGGSIRMARNPANGEVFVLNPQSGLYRVKLDAPASATQAIQVTDIITDAVPSGMAFGPDGTLFVVANRTVRRLYNQAVIRRGMAVSGGFRWETLAQTEPYPLSNTPFDHLYNGIAVSPDGTSVFVNAGSRTDHGEVENNGFNFPDAREVPLTSAILRLPADARDLVLPNNETGLKPYLFADGTRNAYDPAFAPNGELFVGDNGPDADYPDELNWIREGRHYGFPWRFGNQDNPQQFPDYDSAKDKRLQKDFTAVQKGTYKNDPSFPKPPGTFTDPVANHGPDAVQYRADDGEAHDAAAEGQVLYSFTPHRSPLGLVFADDPKMPADLRGEGDTLSAFIVSWGAAGGTLTDRGQDLLHLQLTKQGDTYEATTTQIARGFKNPIDAVMIENRLYVLEFGAGSAIWELTFQ
jgi:glucose/arabinose dehydrogenase